MNTNEKTLDAIENDDFKTVKALIEAEDSSLA